jgi:hypothetical protein
MMRTVLIGGVLAALALTAILAECWYLRSRQIEFTSRLAQEREQAEQGEAGALLENALSALRRRAPDEGLRLLTAYLAHTQAVQTERAERLAAGVRRATAVDRAAALVRRLNDEQLNQLDAGGDQLPVGDDLVNDPLVKPIFLDVLRGQLPRERRYREGVRAAERTETERLAREQAEREARVRASAPYRDFVKLAADVR